MVRLDADDRPSAVSVDGSTQLAGVAGGIVLVYSAQENLAFLVFIGPLVRRKGVVGISSPTTAERFVSSKAATRPVKPATAVLANLCGLSTNGPAYHEPDGATPSAPAFHPPAVRTTRAAKGDFTLRLTRILRKDLPNYFGAFPLDRENESISLPLERVHKHLLTSR